MMPPLLRVNRLQKTLLLGLGVLLSVGFLFPVYWMLASAFKSEQEILKIPPSLFFFEPTLDNFRRILAHPEDTPVLRWFLNSTFVATSYAVLATAVSALAAFPLARMEFRGRGFYTALLFSSLIIPPIMLIIPSFVIVDWLRWTDTYAAVIFPGLGGVFGVLMLRQYFLALPADLEEAAAMDGANSWQVFRHVVLPLSESPLLTLLVMSFMASWNEYFWPLLTLYSPGMRTMPLGMATLQGRYTHHYGVMMAGALLIAIPSMILFVVVQKYYVRSIAESGMKV